MLFTVIREGKIGKMKEEGCKIPIIYSTQPTFFYLNKDITNQNT